MVHFICLQNTIILKRLGISIVVEKLLFYRPQVQRQMAWHEVFYVAEICLPPAMQTLAQVRALQDLTVTRMINLEVKLGQVDPG